MERSLLENVYENRISLQPVARTFVQTMGHHGAICIPVSDGFNFFTRRISVRIGFHDHRGNELAFEDGKLTRLCDEKGLTPADVLALGDGANDIEMIKAAGLGAAFHGSDSLRNQANACIDHGDLTTLLYIRVFSKSEIVLS